MRINTVNPATNQVENNLSCALGGSMHSGQRQEEQSVNGVAMAMMMDAIPSLNTDAATCSATRAIIGLEIMKRHAGQAHSRYEFNSEPTVDFTEKSRIPTVYLYSQPGNLLSKNWKPVPTYINNLGSPFDGKDHR